MTIRSTDDCQGHMRVKIDYDYGVIFIIDFMTATVTTPYDSIENTISDCSRIYNCSNQHALLTKELAVDFESYFEYSDTTHISYQVLKRDCQDVNDEELKGYTP